MVLTSVDKGENELLTLIVNILLKPVLQLLCQLLLYMHYLWGLSVLQKRKLRPRNMECFSQG